jgi:hypothetical protein
MSELKQKLYYTYTEFKDQYNLETIKTIVEKEMGCEITPEDFNNYIEEIKEINDRVKLDNNWKFGVELEFGGYDNHIKYDPDDEDDLVQDRKYDCSVAGDGTEYNLKPVEFAELEARKPAFESLLYRMANKNCLISYTAGQHVHYSWDNLTQEMGLVIKYVMNPFADMSMTLEKGKEIELVLAEDVSSESSWYKNIKYTPDVKRIETSTSVIRRKLNVAFEDAYNIPEEKKGSQEEAKTRVLYNALRWIYSTSNRAGTEPYGLGNDGTRGYTRHETIELRCWRTTTDYRSVIARAIVGRLFLRFVIKLAYLEKAGFVDYTKEDIWKEMKKDINVENCFKYLAFHKNNKHNVGYSEKELEQLMNISHPMVLAIKKRSDMIQKALVKGTNESDVKELFRNI